MSIEYKDYYQALGVGRTATPDDIKRAFRKLAREFHPDVAKDKKRAEERFKEINEAYEVLGDPEKRRRYDELGPNWRDGGVPRPGPGAGPAGRGGRFSGQDGQEFEYHFDGTGFSDFFEQLFGRHHPGGGRGAGRGAVFEHEDGRGEEPVAEADLMVSLDEVMRGSVRTIVLERIEGGGSGRTGGGTEQHQVRIPAGVREGQLLRVPLGKARKGSGVLFLRVRVAQHPDFRLENDVLVHELRLAPWEAALGATVSVPTPDGSVQIRIPAGSQPGNRLRVRGHGLTVHGGGRGDLFVELSIVIPERLDAGERALWERLAEGSGFQPRA